MAEKPYLPDLNDAEKLRGYYTQRSSERRIKTTILWLVIVCLLSTNIFTYSRYRQPYGHLDVPRKGSEDVLGLTQYAGLSYNTPVAYSNHTDYWGQNQTLSDELWDNININPLAVILDDEYAQQHDLPASVFRFPWDESKGVYFLKVFHSLHCLKAIRRAFVDYERGLPPTVHAHHIHHCLDGMRQDLLCNADDTPMPMNELPDKIGHNQVRMCRNYDDLVAWTQEPERNACYYRYTDYGRRIEHQIESYAHCPEDSPYYQIQEAYFEKWGHHNAFGEGEAL